jgi:hypothetical protein
VDVDASVVGNGVVDVVVVEVEPVVVEIVDDVGPGVGKI